MTNTTFVSRMLTSGGDCRIRIPKGQNTNRYGSSPYPRSTLGYASSTSNDISLPAFEHLCQQVASWPEASATDARFYESQLEDLRHRLRATWGIDAGTSVVFAPSGTDLEYVALALAGPGTTNILVGADEVGSGCILSAAGRYFAPETAVSPTTRKGEVVQGFEGTELLDIPVRDARGMPRSSAAITYDIEAIARREAKRGRPCLAHLVYGSKTGLILPELADLDRLRRCYPAMRFVVDACQARISGADIQALLDRECVVLLTGSKFMGGPPFSGMALIPAYWSPPATLPQGLAKIFRSAEWPNSWAACEHLPTNANPGLLLRLEAAQFELERFNALSVSVMSEVIKCFSANARTLAATVGAKLVEPCLQSGALYASTLATLDLTPLPTRPDLAMAQRWHRVLAARGLRLGQPVKCVRHPEGGWGGTLRLSLSMPLIGEFARMNEEDMRLRMENDMGRIASVILAAQRAVVA